MLSNKHSEGLFMARHAVVDPAEGQWEVLSSMRVCGTAFLARVGELKARKAATPKETDCGRERRKTGHRSRDSVPWCALSGARSRITEVAWFRGLEEVLARARGSARPHIAEAH